MSKKKHKKIRKQGLPPGTLIYTGDRSELPATVHSIRYAPDTYQTSKKYEADWQQIPEEITWIDVCSLTDTALVQQIGADFLLHPLALEDILNTQQRPKMEEYENCLFIILHNFKLNLEPLELVSEQVAVFMGARCVISFQEDTDDTLKPVRKRAQSTLGRLRNRGADYLCYAILDTIVDNYYSVLDDIETVLTDLETTILNNGAKEAHKARIFDLKRVINQFRHRILPLRDAMSKLHRCDAPIINESTRPFLRDLADHVVQIMESIDQNRDLLNSVESLYQAEVSNRLNNVMRLLTIISTIFIPLSFIAGLYGMNFDNMPELHWQYGYFMVLGFMLMAILGMLAYFRRQGWI